MSGGHRQPVGPPPSSSFSNELKLLYFKHLEQFRSEKKSPVWFTRFSVPAEVGPLSVEGLASDAWENWCKDGVVCFGFRSLHDVLKIYFGNPRDQSVYHVVDFDCRKFNPYPAYRFCFILVGSKIYVIGGVNVYSCNVATPQSADTGGWKWSEGPKLPNSTGRAFDVMLFSLLGNLYAVSLRQSSTELHVLKHDRNDWEAAASPQTPLGEITHGSFVFEQVGHSKFLIHSDGLKNVLFVYDAIMNEWSQFDYDYPILSRIFSLGQSNLDSLLVTRAADSAESESFLVSCSDRLFALVDFLGIDLDTLLHRNLDAFCHLFPIGDQKFCFLALYGEEFLTDGCDEEKDHAGEDGYCFVRFGQRVKHVGDNKRRKLSVYKVVNSNLNDIQIAEFALNMAPLEFC